MRRRSTKSATGKKISYELIDRDSIQGRGMYDLLQGLIQEHHTELMDADARILLAWCTSWKPDDDGRVTIGKCKKASDLDRELAPFDFVVLLSREFWTSPHVNEAKQRALLDHELMHAAVKYDKKTGDPARDERDRPVFRVRKHDIEEFGAIVARHGCYKRELELFATALRRAPLLKAVDEADAPAKATPKKKPTKPPRAVAARV